MPVSISTPAAIRWSRSPTASAGEHVTLDEGHRVGVAHDRAVDDRAQHVLLGAEAGVDGLDRDAGTLRDRRHGGARPPGLLEQLGRRRQHLGLGVGRLPGPQGRRVLTLRRAGRSGRGGSSPWVAF